MTISLRAFCLHFTVKTLSTLRNYICISIGAWCTVSNTQRIFNTHTFRLQLGAIWVNSDIIDFNWSFLFHRGLYRAIYSKWIIFHRFLSRLDSFCIQNCNNTDLLLSFLGCCPYFLSISFYSFIFPFLVTRSFDCCFHFRFNCHWQFMTRFHPGAEPFNAFSIRLHTSRATCRR